MRKISKADAGRGRFLFFLLLVFFLLPVLPAYAACIDGLPCVVDKTANDPFNDTDGPNVSGAPNASKNTSGACDADFMNQIYSRALLEAEREHVLSQIAIRKPDSILDYTCFNDVATFTAQEAGKLFSDSTITGPISIEIPPYLGSIVLTAAMYVDMKVAKSPTYTGPLSLYDLVYNLVLTSLESYLNTNFSHSAVGGVASAGFGCPQMNAIYHLAKCMDFAVDDPLFSFDTLAGMDPRALPNACGAGATMITTDYIDVANNKDFSNVNFDASTENYLDRLLMDPGAGYNCFNPAIPTGLKIKLEKKDAAITGKVSITDTDDYQEHVCPNPGCYYDFKTDKCK